MSDVSEISKQIGLVKISADNFQEDDEPASEQDKELVRFYSVGADVAVEFFPFRKFAKRTRRICKWGKVVKVDPSGWVTLQTGKSMESLAKFHAASVRPFLISGSRFFHPQTSERGRILFQFEPIKQGLNPWIRNISISENDLVQSSTQFEDLRGWTRREPLEFVDDIDDRTGYRNYCDLFAERCV